MVDEHGGTEGIVTLADIVEELISDAVPMAERGLYIEAVGDGRLIVSGGARLDDINDLLVRESGGGWDRHHRRIDLQSLGRASQARDAHEAGRSGAHRPPGLEETHRGSADRAESGKGGAVR